MRRFAKVVAVVLAVGLAAPARAADRGALTGVGLGFVVLSLMSFGVGAGGLATSGDAARTLATFDAPLPQSEAGAFRATSDRLTTGTVLGAVGLVLGGLSLGAGIVCLVVDGQGATATVSFSPLRDGGAVTFSARF